MSAVEREVDAPDRAAPTGPPRSSARSERRAPGSMGGGGRMHRAADYGHDPRPCAWPCVTNAASGKRRPIAEEIAAGCAARAPTSSVIPSTPRRSGRPRTTPSRPRGRGRGRAARPARRRRRRRLDRPGGRAAAAGARAARRRPDGHGERLRPGAGAPARPRRGAARSPPPGRARRGPSTSLRAGDRPFLNAASVGPVGRSPPTARAPLKRALGPLAYAVGAAARRRDRQAAALPRDRRRRRAVRGRGVAGHRRRHGRVRRRRGVDAADPADRLARRGRRRGAARALGARRAAPGACAAAASIEQPGVRHARGRASRSSCRRGTPFNVDGEVCDLGTPARFAVARRARRGRGVREGPRDDSAGRPGSRRCGGGLVRERLAAPPPRAGPRLRAARRGARGRRRASSCALPRRSPAAPISDGNDVELLINGDEIFPALPGGDPRARSRRSTS